MKVYMVEWKEERTDEFTVIGFFIKRDDVEQFKDSGDDYGYYRVKKVIIKVLS